MDADAKYDEWSAGRNYEQYMGRWSRWIVGAFLPWLAAAPQLDWLELGCGSGALSSAVLAGCSPHSLMITDLSSDFLEYTKRLILDPRADYEVADAQSLPFADARFDLVVSGLTLNFVPDRKRALEEMRRVVRPGGTVAFFVWDYPGEGIGFIDAFWKAAAELDPAAAELDESARFPFCTEDGLAELCRDVWGCEASVRPIEIVTEFADFDAFWHPFTLGAGPAPGYCKSLSPDRRATLKAVLARKLGQAGPLRLPARAWGVKAAVSA